MAPSICGNSKSSLTLNYCNNIFSSYPSKRVEKDDKGMGYGVMGKVNLLQNVTFSSQPISSMDWSQDKVVWELYNGRAIIVYRRGC